MLCTLITFAAFYGQSATSQNAFVYLSSPWNKTQGCEATADGWAQLEKHSLLQWSAGKRQESHASRLARAVDEHKPLSQANVRWDHKATVTVRPAAGMTPTNYVSTWRLKRARTYKTPRLLTATRAGRGLTSQLPALTTGHGSHDTTITPQYAAFFSEQVFGSRRQGSRLAMRHSGAIRRTHLPIQCLAVDVGSFTKLQSSQRGFGAGCWVVRNTRRQCCNCFCCRRGATDSGLNK